MLRLQPKMTNFAPCHAGSSEAAVLANTTVPSYNGTYDLDGALPNAFVNMTCVDASGSYDKVAPFMDAFLDGLRIDSVILAAWALLFLVRALHAPQSRAAAPSTNYPPAAFIRMT